MGVIFGLLGIGLALAIPVLIIVLLVSVHGLKARVGLLERSVRELRSRPMGVASGTAPAPTASPWVAPAPAAAAAPPADERIAATGPATETQATDGPEPAGWETAALLPPVSPAGSSGPMAMPVARSSAFGNWIRANWILAIAAVSLALAGIFFVQYGMENGLLPPGARVLAALVFGLALVGAGEWLRRRTGDGAGSAHLPSAFAGAGVVSMFAAIIAARQLYGLVGVEVAFGGLVAVAALAVLLGWFYGPFLAGFGLVGAAVAPFAVGGSSDAPYWLFAYFTLIAGAGLFIDTVRRWAWVSVLALVLGYGGGLATMAGIGDGAGWWGMQMTVLAVLAILVPCLALAPDHQGAMCTEALSRRSGGTWPIFPTRLAAGAILASVLGLMLVMSAGVGEGMLALSCLALLAGALIFWSGRARALCDLAAVPVAGLLVGVGLAGLDHWPMAEAFGAQAMDLRGSEVGAPMTAGVILAVATLISLLAAWRSRAGDYRAIWAAGAALVAPLMAVVLELTWHPALVIGAYPWALQVMALAGLMALLAVRFARADAPDMRRAAYGTLSCLSLIALALFLVTTKGALTVALAALVAIAAGLDRRFRLPEMGWFIQAAVMGISYRLVIDPGLAWAVDQSALWEVVASYGGAAAGMAGALFLLRGQERRGAQVFLESGGAAAAALFANVLITRWLTKGASPDQIISHWALTLNATPWLILALTQLYRLKLGGRLGWLRWLIASVAGLLALAGLGGAVTFANPLVDFLGSERLVRGTYLFDTLMVAYLLPGVILIVAALRMDHLGRWLRWPLLAIGAGLGALYAALEIRRFWQGDDLSVPGVTQPELYSYTVAMMLLGAALLYQAITRNSTNLRRAAMAVIGLTVAKVFLIDASGLSGLTRVFSFLALGLALAGLAWLNRWAAGRQSPD